MSSSHYKKMINSQKAILTHAKINNCTDAIERATKKLKTYEDAYKSALRKGER